MKNLVVIISHCDNDPKLEALRNLINKIKQNGLDAMVITHIPLPKDIQNSVEYMVYDKSNPILNWPEYGNLCWMDLLGGVKLLNVLPEHGWTVFNQIINAGNLGIGLNYTHFTFVNYDTIITEEMFETVKSPEDFVVSDQLIVRWGCEEIIPTLLFNIFSKENLKKLLPLISKEEFKSTKNAETYWGQLRENFEYVVYPKEIETLEFTFYNLSEFGIKWYDFNSKNEKFKYFVDSKEENLVVYDVEKSLNLHVNGIDILISEDEIIKVNGIESIGFYIEKEFIDLLPTYKNVRKFYPNRWIKVKDKDI